MSNKTIDLYKNKYDQEFLKKNIYALELNEILKTQILTEEFCVNYILNKFYQLTPEEENITIIDVLKYQPHLDKIKLIELYLIGPSEKKDFLMFDSFLNEPSR